MPDLKSLATKLPADKDYRGGHGDVKGFVCPRADSHGGREGIIPPGIAAEHGLVPKGMRRVTIAQALETVNAQIASGQSEQERYLAYYGRGAADRPPAKAPAAAASAVPEVRTSARTAIARSLARRREAVSARPAAAPSVPSAPAPARQVRRAEPTAQTQTAPGNKTVRPVKSATKKASRMFPSGQPAETPDDTLDGFYDSLRGSGLGTDEVGRPGAGRRKPGSRSRGGAEGEGGARRPAPAAPARTVPVSRDPPGGAVLAMAAELARDFLKEAEASGHLPNATAEFDAWAAAERRNPVAPLPEPAGADDPEAFDAAGNVDANAPEDVPMPAPSPEPDADDEILAAVDRLEQERDQARQAYAELHRDYLVLEQEVRQLKKELQSRKPPVEHETVRVQLAGTPVKLKVGGRGWECRVMGHLDYTRTRNEVVLTVVETQYGAELLAEIQKGECIIVSERGRTACAYDGDCAKIYGDPGSSDFITCLRFSCDHALAEA